MTIINAHINNPLKWIVLKGLSNSVEDFSRSKVMLFAISETNKIPLQISRYNVFKVDTNSTAQKQTIYIKSTAQVYGYDGLSAYEIAMMKAENPKSENEWLRDLLSEKADKNGNSSEDFYTHDLTTNNIDSQQITATDIIVQNHVITQSIKNPIDPSSHSIMVPNARTSAERILTTSDGKNYGCSLSYSHNEIKLLGDNGQELSFIEAYDRQDADSIFDDLRDSINEKADASTVYTKGQIDGQMEQKADGSYVDNTFATKLDLNQEAFEREQKDDRLDNIIDGVSTRVDTVEGLIPTEAYDEDNMLADKKFVNSSISTNTATFRGSYNIVTDLGLPADADDNQGDIAPALLNATSSCENNDYCFAAIPVSNQTPTTIKEVRRFKYSKINNDWVWVYEYTLNNSGFTAAQWAAINSNITSNLTAKLSSLPTFETLESALNSKANIYDVYTINQADTTFIKQSEKIDQISDDVVDNSRVPTNLAVRLLGGQLITALVSKQDVINDLNTIRSNASGALQRSGSNNMTGNLDLNNHALLVRNINGLERPGIQFRGSGADEGVYVGNGSMRMILETGANDTIRHKQGGTYNVILDSGNTKTINGNSILGSGNIEINNVFKVEYRITNYDDIISAIDAGMFVYAEDQAGVDYKDIYVPSTIVDNGVITFVHVSSSSTLSFSVSPDSTYTSITEYDIQSKLNSKQDAITSTNKLSADLVSDSTYEHRFVTASQKTLWNTVTEKAPLPFVVHCGISPEDVPFINSTLDEIWTAYQNGKNIRVKFTKAEGISFEDDATILLDGSHNCVAHTVHNGTHYTITIYDDNGVTKLSYEETHDSDKQDVISDLSTIRSGAAAGATAYQKPQSGIPASDIASDVIPDISNLANKSGSLSQDFAAKSLGVLGRGTSNGIKLYRSDGQIPYGRIIMESDLVSSGIDYMLPTTGVAEQSAVVLATKASVDAKYTKPSSGIPASDIANGVIPDVSQFITKSVNDLVMLRCKTLPRLRTMSCILSAQAVAAQINTKSMYILTVHL